MTPQGTATAAAIPLPDQPVARRTAPRRRRSTLRLLLSAIVLCATFGALGCAAGLAAGSTHAGHFPTTAVPDRATHLHGAHYPPSACTSASTDAAPPTVAVDRPDGASPIEHEHEAVACKASIDLRPRDLTVTTTVQLLAPTPTLALVESHARPDPPVPRRS